MDLSPRAKALKPSPTLALAAKARELKSQGQDVISLSVGEPDWDTFDVAKQAGIEAIDKGFSKYTPASGIPELKKAICRQFSEDFGVDYLPSQVCVGAGGKYVIYGALQCLMAQGDEVIIPAPYWVSYPDMVTLSGAKPVIVKSDEQEQFKLTPARLEEAINPNTKLLLLNYPSNPTGLMLSKEDLSLIADVLRNYPQVAIISDDIYNHLAFTEDGLAPHLLQVAPDLQDRTIAINGCSKSYSMTGWRMGWALGPEDVIRAMGSFQSQTTGSSSSISQKAALAAIEQGETRLKECRQLLRKRLTFALSQLADIQALSVVPPQGAFYLWVSVKNLIGKHFKENAINGSKDFAQMLLEDKQVVLVPGVEFGCEGYVRMSFAIGEERLGEAFQRIESFVSELK